MAEPLTLVKSRVGGEDRFTILVLRERKKLNDPFMSSSSALSEQEVAEKLRQLEITESEIQRLIANAKSAGA